MPRAAAVAADPTAHGVLHWAPRHDPGLAARSAAVAEWIRRARPSLVVVDVSVEIAVLSRLCGVPVVVLAMPGVRTDRTHGLAYDLADALLAPWPEAAHTDGWPAAWRAKLWAVGGLSRFDGRRASRRSARSPVTRAGPMRSARATPWARHVRRTRHAASCSCGAAEAAARRTARSLMPERPRPAGTGSSADPTRRRPTCGPTWRPPTSSSPTAARTPWPRSPPLGGPRSSSPSPAPSTSRSPRPGGRPPRGGRRPRCVARGDHLADPARPRSRAGR